ncbi:hypothetical protein ACV2X7_27670, partial [Escherichia coli]
MTSPTTTGAVWTFDAIGTAWSIDTEEPLSATARAAVATVVNDFDREWSRFRDDSLVTALAEGHV